MFQLYHHVNLDPSPKKADTGATDRSWIGHEIPACAFSVSQKRERSSTFDVGFLVQMVRGRTTADVKDMRAVDRVRSSMMMLICGPAGRVIYSNCELSYRGKFKERQCRVTIKIGR